MKKKYIYALATILVLFFGWKLFDTFKSNDVAKVDPAKVKAVEKSYDSLDSAFNASESLLKDNYNSSNIREELFKNKDGKYSILYSQMLSKDNVGDIVNSYITMDKDGKSDLKMSKDLIKSFKDKGSSKTWKESTDFGKVEYYSGLRSKKNNLDLVYATDPTNKYIFGFSVFPDKDVIRIDEEGLWRDSKKQMIGNNKLKDYTSESEALNSVIKSIKEPGKKFDVIKRDKVNYYLFKNNYHAITEWTVVPVLNENGQFKAGKYHRFSLMDDNMISSKHTDKIEDVNYTVIFERAVDHPKEYEHMVKDKDLKIAIKEK